MHTSNNLLQKEGSKWLLQGKIKCKNLIIHIRILFAHSNRWLNVFKLRNKIINSTASDKFLKLAYKDNNKWRQRGRKWLKMQQGLKKLKPWWSRMLGRGEWSNKKSYLRTFKRVICKMFWGIHKFRVSRLKKGEFWVRVLENKEAVLLIHLLMLITLVMTI